MADNKSELFHLARARIRDPERDAAVAALGLTELWEAAHTASEAAEATRHTAPADDTHHLVFDLPADATMPAYDQALVSKAQRAWQAYDQALDAAYNAWAGTPEGIEATIGDGI